MFGKKKKKFNIVRERKFKMAEIFTPRKTMRSDSGKTLESISQSGLPTAFGH